MGRRKELELKMYVSLCLICGFICIRLMHDFLSHGRTWLFINVTWLAAVLLILALLLWNMVKHNPADSHSLKTLLIQHALMSIMCKVGARVKKKLYNISNNLGNHQEKLLLDIVRKNEDTKYGEKYEFVKIYNRYDYVSRTPLMTYPDMHGYINEIVDGEQEVLTSDKVIYLAETSGTTGKSKVIPVTHDMKGPTAMKVGPLMYHQMHLNGKLDLKRVFILSYKPKVTQTKCGLIQGPISYHMSRYVPFSISPPEVFQVQYEQTALHLHAVFALREREIGHIEALMTTLVYAFWLYLDHHWTDVCNDIEHGRLSIMNKSNIEDYQYIEKLQDYLTPDPKRASELRIQFSYGFRSIATRVWPDLRFARMLNTGGFAHHAKILRKHYMSGVKQLSQAHAASEGFMGFNLSENPCESLYTAMVDYGFMEFIPEEEIHNENPRTYFAEQVNLNGLYEIVITTPMGLYRYRTGDVVKIVKFLNQCPIYEFQYRLGQLLNLYWEKTPESVFYKSVEDTLAKLDDTFLVDYTVTEDVHVRNIIDSYSKYKRYVMFIEVLGNDNDARVLETNHLKEFDRELTDSFEMYRKFRENGSIGPMKVYQLKRGTFEELKTIIISRTQTQQYKVPRVIRKGELLNFLWNKRLII